MNKILSITLLFFTVMLSAQDPAQARLYTRMDQAVELMNQGDYETADEEFRYVMKHMTALPSEMAYYFGKNSYYLSKYKQSINWLNKYIQLKGTQGRFHEEAVKFLQLAEDEYLKQSREASENVKEELGSGVYDCGGLEKMICPVCKGQGVLLKEGPFETIYKTCPYSAGEAYLSCEEYNQFMRGELEPKISN